MAWPADGLANHARARESGRQQDQRCRPGQHDDAAVSGQSAFTPASAKTSTPDGVTGDMRVLLSDDTITQILGTANAPSDPPATSFAVEQRFLAETAMIAAQAPSVGRSIVVAPPRRWDPPARLASGCCRDGQRPLAAAGQPRQPGHRQACRRGRSTCQPPTQLSQAELSGRLLRRGKAVDQQVDLLKSVRATRTRGWTARWPRWSPRPGGAAARRRQGHGPGPAVSAYLSSQEGS